MTASSRLRRPRLVDGVALIVFCGVLLAEAAWVRRAKSVTVDETFYLSCALQSVHDGRLDPRLAADGVAPVPVMLAYLPPLALGSEGQDRPDPWKGALQDPEWIVGPRLLNTLLCGVPLVAAVFVWLYRRRGIAGAVFGGGMVALSPTIVAHASLATTDVCFALATVLATAALVWYLQSPNSRRLVVLAVAVAAAMAAKYSGLFLLLVVAASVFLFQPMAREPAAIASKRSFKTMVRTLALFACLVGPIWWGLHLFSFSGPLKGLPIEATPDDSRWVKLLGRGQQATWFMDLAYRKLKQPAPVAGVVFQGRHNRKGHAAFLMGERSETGWWYFFPYAFAFKSTPSELILTAGLAVLLVGSLRRPRATLREADITTKVLLLSAGVYTAMVLTSRIAIGHRYLMVLYPLLAILGTDRLFARLMHLPKVATLIACLLLAGQAMSNAAIAPDWLAYFNAASGGPAEGWKLLVDSSLDWGQDLPALQRELEKRPGAVTALRYFGSAAPKAYGVYADSIETLPRDPAEYALLAVSATDLQGVRPGDDPLRFFRSVRPAARAGYSIFLFDLDTPEKRAAFREAARRIRAAAE